MNGAANGPAWTPPETAARAARALFVDRVRDLDSRACGYRVNTDLLDDGIFGVFVAELHKGIAACEAAVAAREEAELRRRGHSIEGMGGTIGLPELSVVGEEIGRAAKGHTWDRCALLVAGLRQWLAVADGSVPGGKG
jgi:HPt (histidine-containing phosphotransfer) domain-containing protein